jgi:hypothetical protein
LRSEADDRRNDESGQYGPAIDKPHGDTHPLGLAVAGHGLRPKAPLEGWLSVEKCRDGIL